MSLIYYRFKHATEKEESSTGVIFSGGPFRLILTLQKAFRSFSTSVLKMVPWLWKVLKQYKEF